MATFCPVAGERALSAWHHVQVSLQPIGLRHPAAELVRDVQNNRTGIPRRSFVAEGLFEINMVLATAVPVEVFLWCPEAAYSDESAVRSAELISRARRSYQIAARTLERLAERPNPDGMICVAQLPDWQPDDLRLAPDALLLVADGMEIPGNLGTLIRTMDACAADCLVLTTKRTRLTHPRVLRSSQGMNMKVPSLEFDTIAAAVGWLASESVTVYLADTDESISYRRASYAGRTAIVVGSERYGISPAWYEHGFARIGIPMLGAADSLNVSVSASVLLYEARARKNGW
jgi:TrmH family RNA methyltransferase